MRVVLFAAIAAIVLLAGCAAIPPQQNQAGGGQAVQPQQPSPAGQSGTGAAVLSEGEAEKWLNSYDADLNQSAQDFGQAG